MKRIASVVVGLTALFGVTAITWVALSRARAAPVHDSGAPRGIYPAVVQATGVVREFELVAKPTRIPLLDGRPLEVWAYNGQVPGPVLRATVGDTVRVHFRNELPQPTTIHWHGIRLPNAMDGVPGVTQPPIRPGEQFTYEFLVKDAGTFWFHPHVRGSEQVERGLHGILIVDDVAPRPYSREILFVLDDWRLDATGQIDERFNTRHDLAHDGRWGGVITVNGVTRSTLTLEPGERVRIRMVNVANGRMFAPDFGRLGGLLVAMDGLYSDRPLAPAGLELAPGNRADLDLTVPVELAGQSLEIIDRFTRSPVVLADVRITEGPVTAPTFEPPRSGGDLDLSRARTLAPTETFRLNARMGGPFGIEWTINDRVMRHDEHEPEHADAHSPVYKLPVNRWVLMRFVNESYRLHPMHTHGQFFRVVARNGTPVDEGHWRDTVLIKAKETVDVVMYPQDEGAWMLHCHIQEHAESGMMTLVDVAARD